MMRRKTNKPGPFNIMWLIVMFDLPTKSRTEQKRATTFRNSLLELGFSRKQFSVYMRHCASLDKAKNMASKVKKCLNFEGLVSIIYITDRQFGMVENYFGKKRTKNEAKKKQEEKQLLLF